MESAITELDVLCDQLARLWVEADTVRRDARRVQHELAVAQERMEWLASVPSQGDWNRDTADV